MAVDQTVLQAMINGADKDATTAEKNLSGVNDAITLWTSNDSLYKELMDKARSNLVSYLATKVTALGGVGVVYGDKFPTAPPYTRLHDIGDWYIDGGTWRYSYQNQFISVYGPYADHTENVGSITVRNLITFPSSYNKIRIQVLGHKKKGSAIWHPNIAIKVGNQNIDPSTQGLFYFDGEDRVSLLPNQAVYSDWLTYSVSPGTNYYISMFCEETSESTAWPTATGCWNVDGWDCALDATWDSYPADSVAPSPTGSGGRKRGLSAIEAQTGGYGQSWDGDTTILRWITAFQSFQNLVFKKPYGTQAMLANLNRALPIVTAMNSSIVDRNSVLDNFVTFDIEAYSGQNGTIVPSGTVSVEKGGSKTFYIYPGVGYIIDDVKVDLVSQGSISSYTFTNVLDGHIIEATFKTPPG